jgi:ATP-binding cassette subfamily B protein
VHWQQNHFVVVYGIKGIKKIKDKGINGRDGENPLSFYPLSFYHSATVLVADPGGGLIKYTAEEFLKGWLSTKQENENEGIALLFETTPEFYATEDENPDR